MPRFSAIGWICLALLVIGGLNRGLVGFFDYNLIGSLFTAAPVVARVIYAAVGVAGLYIILEVFLMSGESEPPRTHPI